MPWFLPPFSVIALGAAELDDGNDQHQYEQHHGNGTCVAVFRGIDEGHIIDVVHQRHGSSAGAALRDHVHLVVDLEAGDGEHNDHKEGGGAQLRQGDVPELLPAICAVQLGGFVQVRVAALQACQIDDHVVAHVLPYTEQDDRDHSGVLTGSPAGQVFHRHAKELVQDHVDGAHGGVEDHVPHRCHRHQRGNIGEERHRAEEVAQLHVLVQQHRHSQRAGQRQMIKQHMPNYGKELNVQETTVYKPEYSWNYEVGSHLSLFNGKLKTDLAAFYMDTHDQQIAKFVNSGLGRMMVNAGSSESYGVEASFLASINKNLNMNVSYGYTHSTFKKYDGGTTSSEEQIDYSGNYVPFVPRHTMNAGANYSFFFDKSNWMQSLTLGMSYTGAGKIYWTEKNNVSQSFYGTLNGRISLQTEALQIDVWGRNLTNKDYTTFYFETMHRGFEQKSRPLQLGVDIRYHF